MEHLIIQVADKEKAEILFKILSALDFVNSVEVMKDQAISSDEDQDFFLWRDYGKIEILLLSRFVNKHGEKMSIRKGEWRFLCLVGGF